MVGVYPMFRDGPFSLVTLLEGDRGFGSACIGLGVD